MATEAAENPSGRVSTVFRRPAERQGAYDFLESKHVAPDAILAAATDATARRAAQFPFVFVPLDGTSLTLTDLARAKDFGSVGARARGARCRCRRARRDAAGHRRDEVVGSWGTARSE
jgi:hypothetical protein